MRTLIPFLLVIIGGALLAAAPPAAAQDNLGYSADGELVSFDAATLPATDALERISRSMGSSYIHNESVKGNVTLDFQRIYYSEAFGRVAERARVKVGKAGNLFVFGNPMTSSEAELHGTVPPMDPNLEADLAGEGENRDYLSFLTGDDGMSVPAFLRFVSLSSGVKIECDPRISHRVYGAFRAVHWRNLLDAVCELCELSASDETGHIVVGKTGAK